MAGRFQRAFWPDVSVRSEAERAVRLAARIAFVVAAVTTAVSLLVWFDVTQLVSRWELLVGLVFAALAFFIARRSRLAAVLALLLYAGGFVLNLVATHYSSLGVLGFVITLAFVNGARGAFSLAQLGDEPKTKREWIAERDRQAFQALHDLHRSRKKGR